MPSHPDMSPHLSPSLPLQNVQYATLDPLQQAFNHATSAVSLNQSAHSHNDWLLVVQQWQAAIARLQTIPQDSENYSKAQQKLAEYQTNLAYATAQQDKRTAPLMDLMDFADSKPAPSPAVIQGLSCTPVSATTDMPLAMTQLSIQADGHHQTLTGCITNHSHQPLTHVAIAYQVTSSRDDNFFQGGVSYLRMAIVATGAVVPFQAPFNLPERATDLTLQAVYWQPNQGEMQGLATEKTLQLP